MARFDDKIHLLIQQLLVPAPPTNGFPDEHPHLIPNGALNGQDNGAQIPEQANPQHPIGQEVMPLPSQILSNPQSMAPRHNVSPSQNLAALPNGELHHEAILEGESNHRPLNRTQYRPRERVLHRDALRGPQEDLIDSEDDSPLAANFINAPLSKFKVPFLE